MRIWVHLVCSVLMGTMGISAQLVSIGRVQGPSPEDAAAAPETTANSIRLEAPASPPKCGSRACSRCPRINGSCRIGGSGSKRRGPAPGSRPPASGPAKAAPMAAGCGATAHWQGVPLYSSSWAGLPSLSSAASLSLQEQWHGPHGDNTHATLHVGLKWVEYVSSIFSTPKGSTSYSR